MMITAHTLIFIVALLHCYFLVLEMFLWTKKQGMRTFRMNQEQANATATLAANQGLYNGFLAAGLLWSLLSSEPDFKKQIAIFFLACVIIAGSYGAYSVNKRIFFVQAVPAILAMLFLFLA